MPLVSVVLPEPRSPVRRTRTGGRRRLANSLPQRVVSSAECVMTSAMACSGTRLQLLEKLVARAGNGGGNFRGEQTGLVRVLRGELRGLSVEVNAERKDSGPVIGLELGGDCGENAG